MKNNIKDACENEVIYGIKNTKNILAQSHMEESLARY